MLRTTASFLVLITLSTFCFLATAYIPDYHMILSRTADQHGRGVYEIEQEIVFAADPEPLRVKETWIIKNEYEMSVSLSGMGALRGLIEGRIVYDKSDKYLPVGGKVSKARLNEDWWQPFFHFRNSKNIKPTLINLKIAPASSLQDRKMQKVDQKTTYTPQPFIRLARTGGAVNYAIGDVTAPGAAATPGLWIQQDQFLVRKLRLPSQTTVSADDYFQYGRRLWLPKKINVEWEQSQAQVLIGRVEPLSAEDKRAQVLNPRQLSGPDLKLPDYAPIREFYQRYR